MQPESNYAKLHLIVMAHILSSSSVVNLLFFTILQKKIAKALKYVYIRYAMLERSVGGIFKHFQAHDFHIGSKQKNCIFINRNEIWEFSVEKIDIWKNKTLIKL